MPDETIDTYNAVATQYKDYNHNPSRKWVSEMDWLASVSDGNASLIEIGCGTGVDITELEKRFDYTGIDGSEKMLELAKEYASEPNKLYVMDIRDLDFAPNIFAAFWCLATLLHVSKADMGGVLNQIWQVLKPGAKGVVTLKKQQPGKKDGYEADELYGGRRRYFSYYDETTFTKFLNEAGFKVIECYEVQARRNLWLCFKVEKTNLSV